MGDERDVMDQVEHSALQQMVILGMATQSLRPRLDADSVTLEESVVLGQMLAGLSNLMLEWAKVLIGTGDAYCVSSEAPGQHAGQHEE